MAEKTNGGSKGPRSRGGSSKSRGRKTGARSGARAGTRGGTRKRRTTGAAPTGPRKNFEPDRDARRDVLQEQLEAEFERPESFGDPLDPEEASQEDIAAELARSHDGGDGDRMEDASEEVEFGIGEGSVAALAGEEDIAAEGNAAAIDSEDAAPIIPAAGEFAEPPLMKTDDDGSPGETDEEDDAGAGAAFAGNDGAPGRERAERPAGRDEGDRLSRLWKQLSSEGGLRLSELSRRERGGRQQERWLFATGKTREGQGAAVIASPKVDSHLLIHGLRFLTELLSEKVAVKQLYLCAPFFEDDLRKAAYLVDPKKARLRLVRITPFDDERGAYRTVETLRPETRDVNRSFSDLLAEVGSARTRRLLQRFKEVAEGALFESGGEEVVCRGRKIYFRMRGEDLLVARPRDNAVLLEILFPRGRTLRLSEKSFSQTLSRIRECFETARKSQNLRSREGSFRLAVREALESREQGLTPLDTDVSVGPNRLRIDLLAARQNGAPVAVQIRTRISLEDIQQGLVAFTALREQGTLLKKVIGERGGLLNPGSDAELCFAALRTHEAGPAITDLLVPRVSFLRVSPDRRWWETPLKFDATGRAAARGAPAAEPGTAPAARRERRARPRPERPSISIEGKNPGVIVSHYDRDGIIANVVAARSIPKVASQRFMSSEDLITFFFTPEVQSTLPEVYDLVLTDLRFRPSTRLSPEAKEAFVESLRAHKGNIYWIDHVYWQDFDRREIEGAIGKSNLVIAPRERTAALAVMKALRSNDEFATKLVDLLYGKLSDEEHRAWGKDWLSIVDYLRNDLDRIETAIKPLLDARPADIDQNLLAEGRRKEEEAETYVSGRDFRVLIFGAYKMVIVDLPGKQTFNYTSVTQKARERYRAQLSLTTFGNSDTIIIANSFTSRKGMNMTQLKDHLTRRFEWLNAVQGHENVITLKIEDLLNNKERLDQVLNEIVRNKSIFA